MRYKGKIALLSVAIIWGLAIVFQSIGMQWIGPWTFNVFRFLLGFLLLIPIWLRKRGPLSNFVSMLFPAAVCGMILALATGLQLIGLRTELSGKVGFITTTYYVFVPLIESLGGRRISMRIWVGVMVAAAGMFLLCGFLEGTGSNVDGILLASAFGFALHIIALKRLSLDYDSIQFSALQYFFAMLGSLVLTLIFERVDVSKLLEASNMLLYSGVVACGIGFTLQTIGQKTESTTTTSLLLSQEAVFSVFFGYVILSERLTYLDVLGCLLIIGGSVLANYSTSGHKTHVYGGNNKGV